MPLPQMHVITQKLLFTVLFCLAPLMVRAFSNLCHVHLNFSHSSREWLLASWWHPLTVSPSYLFLQKIQLRSYSSCVTKGWRRNSDNFGWLLFQERPNPLSSLKNVWSIRGYGSEEHNGPEKQSLPSFSNNQKMLEHVDGIMSSPTIS